MAPDSEREALFTARPFLRHNNLKRSELLFGLLPRMRDTLFMNRAAYILRVIFKCALYLIPVTPLLVWTRFSDPFATSKVVALQILVSVAAVASVAAYWIPRRNENGGKAISYFPISSPLFGALSIFLILSLVSAANGIDFRRSLWGGADRQDGLILWIHFWLWLVLIIQHFSGQLSIGHSDSPTTARQRPSSPGKAEIPEIHDYLRFSFWISVVISLSAIYEWIEKYFGFAGIIPTSMKESFGNRVSGVFGNPIFIGPYLIFHLFYGLYYLWAVLNPGMTDFHGEQNRKAQKRSAADLSHRKKIALAVVVAEILHLVAIFLGISRGVILGLGIGIIVSCLYLVSTRHKFKFLRYSAVIILVLSIAGPGTLWLLRKTPSMAQNPVLGRYLDISITESKSVWLRLLAWKSATSAIKDRPILGWGHDNIYYGMNAHYSPMFVRENPEFLDPQTWWDKSHNAYLDLLAEKGIIGGIAFLALWGLIAGSLWRLSDRVLAVCLASAMAAYLTSNIFAFDSFGSLYALFLFLAPLILDETRRRQETISGARDSAAKAASGSGFWRALQKPASVGILLLALFSIYGSVQVAQASMGYAEAQKTYSKDPYQSLLLYKEAFAYTTPYAAKEKLICAYRTIQSVIHQQIKPVTPDIISYSISLADEAAAALSQDVQVHLLRNDMFNGLGIYLDKKYLADAQAAGEKALELSPYRQEVIFNLARTYLLSEQPARAVALNRKMVESYQDLAVAHWMLGLSLLADNQKKEAKEEIVKSLRMGYKLQSDKEAEAIKPLFEDREFIEITGSAKSR